jgi:hypothetical protein
MKRLILLVASLMAAYGQNAAVATAPAPGNDGSNNGSSNSGSSDAQTPAAATGNEWLAGSFDLGWRTVSGIGGSVDTYRSIINLGDGPRLVNADFTITDPKHRAFDTINVRASDWGGDPYSTVHVDAHKKNWYDFTADYRDIAYFNALPSFADPLLSSGLVLDEQSFDTRRRIGNFEIDILPNHWFTPYFAFDSDTGAGTGVNGYVTGTTAYPVPTTFDDQTRMYRAGVRMEFQKFHVTLEQGGTTFNSYQSQYQPGGQTNYGNMFNPVFGQTLLLSGLGTTYGITGNSIYTKALLTANPFSWLDLSGQFLYSQPTTNVNYLANAAGNLYLPSQILFYSSQQFLLASEAEMPHTTGSFSAELRPFRRLRIIESWFTDRLHNAGSANSTQTLAGGQLGANSSEITSLLLASTLLTNYNEERIDLLYELTPKITLRGGYRYVWGNAADAVFPAEGLASADMGQLRRNSVLGGITYHPNTNWTFSGSAEGAYGSGEYFRTSLYDYQKSQAHASWQALTSLNVAADFFLLKNQNPTPGINYDMGMTSESLSLTWNPQGKPWDFQGSYSRQDFRSQIGYLIPENLQSGLSIYRDNEHAATGLFDLKLPEIGGLQPKFSAGGSFFFASGSRPTQFFEPVGTVWLPVSHRVSLFAEWRYFGYGETFYLFEGFRTHVVTTGLRFTL